MIEGFDEGFIAKRITQLRLKAGVSARSMSLTIGQNPVYINNIESGKSLPSVMGLIYICDFFHITPKEFFDADNPNPEKLNQINDLLKTLNDEQLGLIINVINGLRNGSR